ncbi:MAG: ribonuclease HII [Rhodospirillaceae bacterium]|nr:ribonuclease HII [Rhodospirillaceae bacterium]
MPTFRLERALLAANPEAVIAGIDEAGRGPWAGPVVAGAAILDESSLPRELRDGLDDSKALTPARREELFELLQASSAVHGAVGLAEVHEIDAVNILQATHFAMARALAALSQKVDIALVDGNRAPPLDCAVQTVIKGDSLSLSIAAASILAKVTRDRVMMQLAAQHPGYGWETNMGYGTPEHNDALKRLGVTVHHRRTFAPVRAMLFHVARP